MCIILDLSPVSEEAIKNLMSNLFQPITCSYFEINCDLPHTVLYSCIPSYIFATVPCLILPLYVKNVYSFKQLERCPTRVSERHLVTRSDQALRHRNVTHRVPGAVHQDLVPMALVRGPAGAASCHVQVSFNLLYPLDA